MEIRWRIVRRIVCVGKYSACKYRWGVIVLMIVVIDKNVVNYNELYRWKKHLSWSIIQKIWGHTKTVTFKSRSSQEVVKSSIDPSNPHCKLYDETSVGLHSICRSIFIYLVTSLCVFTFQHGFGYLNEFLMTAPSNHWIQPQWQEPLLEDLTYVQLFI